MQKIRNNNFTVKSMNPGLYGMRLWEDPLERNKKIREHKEKSKQGFCGDLDLSHVEKYISEHGLQRPVNLKDLLENEQLVTNADRKAVYDFFNRAMQIVTNRKDTNDGEVSF